jgi:hypothetical protein
MRYICLLIICSFVLVSCSSMNANVKPTCEQIVIPDPPKVVRMESKKVNPKTHPPSKYPNTDWVKPPTVDLKHGRGYWTNTDIDKISKGLTDWPRWGKKVEDIVADYNKKVVKESANRKKSSWKFW